MTSETDSIISLAGNWRLRTRSGKIEEFCAELPRDNLSCLYRAGLVPDPYYGRNELELQWLQEEDWIFEREIHLERQPESAFLYFEVLDTVSAIYVNDQLLGQSQNMYLPYCCNVAPCLQKGSNKIRLEFSSHSRQAKQRSMELPYPVPHNHSAVQFDHINLLRKAPCHGGWDWGPCLMVSGSYGKMELQCSSFGIISQSVQVLEAGANWELVVQLELQCQRNCEAELLLRFQERDYNSKISIVEGSSRIQQSIQVSKQDVQRWWPNGMGAQPLYPLEIVLGVFRSIKKLGFRTIALKTLEDTHGKGINFVVNGREFFAKGSNWIPSDAMPGLQNREKNEHLLRAAAQMHMNMIRVWGGGQYESQQFYELCDEYGLLVWQDFMFSCALYPGSKEFLENVGREVRYQIRRLQGHPCIAIWCGNNETLGALNWYPVSRENRDRYLVDYDRLYEGVIGRIVAEEDPESLSGRAWWPSSPSAGSHDYSDGWHDDSKGDMHYWSVWHEGKPLEAYYDVVPRFCSEFGFQSFPSVETIASFAGTGGERNLTSPVMGHHQKSPKGNTIILETLTRYFRFPSRMEDFVYLSQVQQALAIKMAVEYWRAQMPLSMGALYWQLNDNWPVASWSSIEYTGKFKLLHYEAGRFFNPLHICIYSDKEPVYESSAEPFVQDVGRFCTVRIVNDGDELHGKALVRLYDFDGNLMETILDQNIRLRGNAVGEVLRFAVPDNKEACFCDVEFLCPGQSKKQCRAQHFFTFPRNCELQQAEIQADISYRDEVNYVELQSDKPAFYFYCSLKEGNFCNFSDNGFHLLPGEKRVISLPYPRQLEVAELHFQHLRTTY